MFISANTDFGGTRHTVIKPPTVGWPKTERSYGRIFPHTKQKAGSTSGNSESLLPLPTIAMTETQNGNAVLARVAKNQQQIIKLVNRVDGYKIMSINLII